MIERSLTDGSIFKKLILFALPMIAGNLLQQVYNLVDTFIVGKYIGVDALAAVGASYAFMVFVTSIIIGLCMGSGTFFSADFGGKDNRQLRQDIWLSFWFILSVTAIISLIAYPAMDIILSLLQIPPELMGLTEEYVTIVLAGLFFVFLYNFFAYLMRAVGNSIIPLIFLGISSAMNIVLDLYFVVGMNLGVGGAAWATVLSQGFSGIGLAVYSVIKLPILRNWQIKASWNADRLKKIMVNNFTTCIQQSVMNFGILMIQGLVNSFGVTVMASFAAAVKIDTIAYMPAQEFGNAYSLFISQNYGAGKRDRIKRGTTIAFVTSMIFCAAVSVIIFIFAGDLMEIFVAESERAIIAEGIRYLRIEGAMYVGIGVLFLWYGYFRGINKPHISLTLTVVSLGTRVALSYALAPNTAIGVLAIWFAIPIGWILADLTGLRLYLKNLK